MPLGSYSSPLWKHRRRADRLLRAVDGLSIPNRVSLLLPATSPRSDWEA
jgi:hypothetical protein